jgi:hypothetical protein
MHNLLGTDKFQVDAIPPENISSKVSAGNIGLKFHSSAPAI